MRTGKVLSISVAGILFVGFCSADSLSVDSLPFVKQAESLSGVTSVSAVTICVSNQALEDEAQILREILQDRHLTVQSDPNGHDAGVITLELTDVAFPAIKSSYKDRIREQGYRLLIRDGKVRIQSSSKVGVFYGIQTLRQLLRKDSGELSNVDILDWPDLPVRMLMVDAARELENIGYYKRVIDFCARYKFNVLHLHLTDDEYSCLYHEDYPWLMHPRALRAEDIKGLVEYAHRYHIDIMPEIESLGHAAMFIRHPDAGSILHQSTVRHFVNGIAGYTDVICPASRQGAEYLRKMYKRSAELFPYEYIHIGFDEVDLSDCRRCQQKWPEANYSDLFLKQLDRCYKFCRDNNKKIAIWDDMFAWGMVGKSIAPQKLKDTVPPADCLVMDWNYRHISQNILTTFKELGYDIVGCPSLMCSQHMNYPDANRLANVREFAEIARKDDLLGMDVTIWVPERYLSDAMWTGIAFSAAQCWSNSNFDQQKFYAAFLRDYFGSSKGELFNDFWQRLLQTHLFTPDIDVSLWADPMTLKKAVLLSKRKEAELRKYRQIIAGARGLLAQITPTITENATEWAVLEQATTIQDYMIEHLLASPDVEQGGVINEGLVRQLDEKCIQAIGWVNADWDRNRYSDSPGKDGIDSQYRNQHMLLMLKQVHRFHQVLLSAHKGLEKE